jgi:hypothetical protein
VSFRARLKRRILGLPAGGEVEVTLSLDTGYLHIGKFQIPAQLLLGPMVCSADDREELMGEGV